MKLRYEGFDSTGKPASGVVDAPDAREAGETLRRQGVFVTSVRVEEAGGSTQGRGTSRKQRGRRPAKRLLHISMFTRQLSMLCTAGTQIVQALAALEHALILAEPEGHIRTFVDEGIPMQSLISEYRSTMPANAHPLPGYVDRILDFFPNSTKTVSQPRATKMVEPLSEREMEVLNLLRSELSGPEISQRLTVSLNTLRTHTKNIFNKLGVNNRRAAVRRAEELDLF